MDFFYHRLVCDIECCFFKTVPCVKVIIPSFRILLGYLHVINLQEFWTLVSHAQDSSLELTVIA